MVFIINLRKGKEQNPFCDAAVAESTVMKQHRSFCTELCCQTYLSCDSFISENLAGFLPYVHFANFITLYQSAQ
jgi:hypothetical protein